MTRQGLMAGKRGIILGVANEYSIAWAIFRCCFDEGAEIILTYPNEAIAKRIRSLISELNVPVKILHCNVSDVDEIKNLLCEVEAYGWNSIDFLVHAVAFSDKNELRGRYISTSQTNFLNSMNISCYSLTALAQIFEPLMIESSGASLLTLSYYGAEKVIPHYNVMGICKAALEASVKYLAMDMGIHNIRVNAISAGPLKTLSAMGISDFKYIGDWNKNNSPLRRNVTHGEVGKSALYLLSDLSSGTTGEILHVDCGYNVIGMKAVDAPDIVVNKEKVDVM